MNCLLIAILGKQKQKLIVMTIIEIRPHRNSWKLFEFERLPARI